MSSHTFLIQRAIYLVALASVTPMVAAAEPTPSLAEKRLGIIKGTAPGIVIIDFDKKPSTAASTPTETPAAASPTAAVADTPGSTPPASASASAGAAAQAPTPKPTTTESGFFSALPPPSGRSLQSARRLDAPDQGIALPTARAATLPQADSDAKR